MLIGVEEKKSVPPFFFFLVSQSVTHPSSVSTPVPSNYNVIFEVMRGEARLARLYLSQFHFRQSLRQPSSGRRDNARH